MLITFLKNIIILTDTHNIQINKIYIYKQYRHLQMLFLLTDRLNARIKY